jgi:cytochrome c-type protein NapB
MPETKPQIGKLFLFFAALCVIALPLVVYAAFTRDDAQSQSTQTGLIGPQNMEFDHKGKALFVDYDRLAQEYLKGASSERTLQEYYSRRQYLGAPPFIPHKILEKDEAKVNCLTCHKSGGWSNVLKRHTPLTPHPEQTACRQCHVAKGDAKDFVGLNWQSAPPPRLGRAALPGGPPPIPHTLQMRENCIACHVGPGAVSGYPG